MLNFIAKMIESVWHETTDNPSRIRQFFFDNIGDYYLDIQESKSINLNDVIKWHEFGWGRFDRNRIDSARMWHKENSHIVCDKVHIHQISRIGNPPRKVDSYTCDIQCIKGFSASKSDLSKYTCMHEMATSGSPEMVEPINERKMLENLRWSEIRIINQENSSDKLVKHSWDKRIFLSNSGGSHHFASARYIADQLNNEVLVGGRLVEHSIDRQAVIQLIESYFLYALKIELGTEYSLAKQLADFKVKFAIIDLPKGSPLYAGCILLPKDELRACRVAETLEELNFFNLGQHLMNLASSQSSILDNE